MTTTRDYASKLTHQQLTELNIDYDLFEKQGWIGDGAFRTHIDNLLSSMGIPDCDNFTFWGSLLMMEVYRIGALRHFHITS